MDFSKLSLELKLARFSFLLRRACPFLGELSLLTERVFDAETFLASVKDNKIHINRAKVSALPEPQFNFLILHELMHILLGHKYPANIADGNHMWANIAMDLTVNYAITILRGELRAKSLRVEPLPNSVMPHMFDDLSKDLWIMLYTSFRKQLAAQGVGSGLEPLFCKLEYKHWNAIFPNYSMFSNMSGGDNDDSSSTGNSDKNRGNSDNVTTFIRDVLSNETTSSVAEHKSMLSKAGRRAGTGGLPEFISLAVERLLKDPIPYHIIFRKYLTGLAETDDYCYSSPDRRFLHSGLILPSHPFDTATELRKVVILLDVSSSINTAELKDFLGRMRSILNSFEFDGIVVSFSGDIVQEVRLNTVRSLDNFIASIKVGGGTEFGKAVQHVNKKYPDYACMAVFTDGEFLDDDYHIKPHRTIIFLTASGDDYAVKKFDKAAKVIRLPELDCSPEFD